MTILPLIGRQLLVRARSPAGYWTRFGAALAGTLVCLSTLAGSPNQAQMGAAAFQSLVVAAFILCCFSGFLTVDGISRERREGTLGLLFLTRVRALDVLLGNFGAAGIASLCALAALAPVLVIPVLAGGVTGGEAARTALALFDTMILSLAAGLWASAGGRAWRSCARLAAGVLLLVIFGPFLLEFFGPAFSHVRFSWPGPLGALAAAADAGYKHSAAPYWISIAVVHAISWLLVIGAERRLRRALREEDDGRADSVRLAPGRAPLADDEASPGFMLYKFNVSYPEHKPLAPNEAPLEWLARRQWGARTVVWAGALLGAVCNGCLSFPLFNSRTWGAYFSWGLAFSVVEGCLFAWVASRFFVEARRAGELEVLLTTPEGAKTIISSQWKWLKDVFRWPVVVLVAPELIWILFFMVGAFLNFRGYMLYSFLTPFFSCLNTLAGIVALLWAGMWFGWSERSPARAIVRVVILAKVAPDLIAMLGSLVLRELAPMGMVFNGIGTSWFVLIWLIPQTVTLLFYLWLIRWARRRLAGELPQAKMGF